MSQDHRTPTAPARDPRELLEQLVDYATEAWARTHYETRGENPELAPNTRAIFREHARERLAQVVQAYVLEEPLPPPLPDFLFAKHQREHESEHGPDCLLCAARRHQDRGGR